MSGHEPDPSPGAAGGVGLQGRRASSDDVTPMRVLVLDPAGGTLARCAGIDGVARTIETAFVTPLEPGALVLVRGRIALARLDEEWVP
ncbi:MAG TPA: hypothetical protein VF250_02230 [Conexibacter sp.]